MESRREAENLVLQTTRESMSRLFEQCRWTPWTLLPTWLSKGGHQKPQTRRIPSTLAKKNTLARAWFQEKTAPQSMQKKNPNVPQQTSYTNIKTWVWVTTTHMQNCAQEPPFCNATLSPGNCAASYLRSSVLFFSLLHVFKWFPRITNYIGRMAAPVWSIRPFNYF